ncbi:MAG: cell division protein FtsZ [Flavobacteriales bacterium]|nr:cell division protein FtsZ [Flavobacteriales bacterium]MCX7768353.1 cell division protein FtsZ [Flavobacteriales bacterium]MDW8409087.1 cell division protein FtsZ [Flavobacteriales bacterium]
MDPLHNDIYLSPLLTVDNQDNPTSIIKVIGVGGGGSNAVNHMFNQGIRGVNFMVCNTDAQDLEASPVPVKIQLGRNLTEGRGAGSIPEVGRSAALESIEELKAALGSHTKMAFITAGLGGGTGTGAAPVIADLARQMGILTVAIVTMPFAFEGRRRRMQAEEGLEQLRNCVDTILVISNEKLREIYGNLTYSAAFAKADDVLTTAARSIAEIITVKGYINVDFADVCTVMRNGGNALMGSAMASGENRAFKAVHAAISSPLLNDNCIAGAQHVLLYISTGAQELLMDEITEITDFVQQEAGSNADIIWGTGQDEKLGDNLCVTIIATGFKSGQREEKVSSPEKVKLEITNPESTLIADQPVFEEPVFTVTEKPETGLAEAPALPETIQEPKPEVLELDLTTPVDQIVNLDEPTSPFEHSVEQSESLWEEKPVTASPMPQFCQDTTRTEPPRLDLSKPTVVPPDKTSEDLKSFQSRILRITEASHILRSPSALRDLENEPAFKRRNLRFEEIGPTDQTAIDKPNPLSNWSINDPKSPSNSLFKRNNSYLHGNVD